ncbi:MAG: hypothetical protein KF833_16490 [Verrucomicrobiae bacterium]|nr:hypothetical protein [Verrucomicrobiae bacterium]
MASKPAIHRWRFGRAGGLNQVRFESAEDYRDLASLDQKLWVALTCPVRGLEFDEKTLALIDTDGDARVRAPEIITAIRWTDLRLKDLGALKDGRASLPLDLIHDQTPEGQVLLASARRILEVLEKPDATEIALADVEAIASQLTQTRFNGDGILPAESTDDPFLQKVIQEIAATQGTETDRSGHPGITQARLDTFFEQLADCNAWAARAESEAATLLPLRDATPAAAAALEAVRTKLDDYFARCRLAAFDPRALAALNRKEEDYLAIAARDLCITADEVAGFPLARIEAGRALPLQEGLNPAWSGPIATFVTAVVHPILGSSTTSLTESDWAALKAKLAPHQAWMNGKPASPVAALDLARIRELLASNARADIAQLIAEDRSLEADYNAIADVEKLIRYFRDLHRLLNNFVSFTDFYDRDQLATFQAGTLLLDARACDLCVRVDDPGKHAALAGMAKTYLAYCDCTRASGEKMTIAAAFTNGDSDNLMVGRNGLFYDRKGRDWDATITKVVENPISIRQAFWAPYKKLVRMVEEQVAKRAAEAESASEKHLASAADTAANIDKTKPAPGRKIDVGTVAALGVAFGAIGTLLATIAGHLFGLVLLPFWQIVLAFIAILFIVSGPSMLIAWLKLRQRNLGPILDASGWAVNGRVKVPVSLGRSLTTIAKLPPGSVPAVSEKFAEPPVFWPKLVAFGVALGFFYSLFNHYGLIHKWSEGRFGIDRDLNPPPPSILDKLEEAITSVTAPETNAPVESAEAPADPPAPAPESTPEPEPAPAP